MTDGIIANRYQLLDIIGVGGMGTIYKAEDRLTRDLVALKQVILSASDLDFKSRVDTKTDLQVALTHEFRMLAGLRHPNIISVLDYGYDENGHSFYTMEYIENGTDIRTFSRTVDDRTKVHLLIQLLEGLVYLHRHGIVHRDLKPDNIMVIDNHVKVLDFGLALMRLDHDSKQGVEVVGTIAYIAPELFEGARATVSTDLWAVGIVAYEMFAGRHPYDTRNMLTLFTGLMNETATVQDVGVPEELQAVLSQLLARSPSNRYQRAMDVIHDFYLALGEESAPSIRDEIRESYLQAAKFVGRETELGQLKNALGELTDKRGSAWLIGGESGVGKSRLVDELQTWALIQRVSILRGQAVADSGLPFQMWREVIRRLVLMVQPDELAASILKDIVPDIEYLLGREVADPPRFGGSAYMQRFIVTVVDLFKQLPNPVLLILEDLHWARESLLPIQLMMKVWEQIPQLMIIATYRNDEAHDLPAELPEFKVMNLPRLDLNAIIELSSAMLGDIGRQPEIVDLLEHQSEGNTFFMVEVARFLAEELSDSSDIGMITLPQNVFTGGMKQVLQRRLAKVPPRFQPLLQVAAIMGRRLDLRLLQYWLNNTPNQPAIALETWLTTCANYAVLEVTDQKWQFTHDKLRETLLQDLSIDEMPALHQQVAMAIEANYPDNVAYHELLLEHWYQAGVLEKELYYLNALAPRLIEIRAQFDRVKYVLKRGLQQLSSGDVRQISLWNWLARSYLLQANYTAGEKYAQWARELAEAVGDTHELAKSLSYLGEMNKLRGNFDLAEVDLNHCLRLFRAIDDKHGIAHNVDLLSIIELRKGDYDKAKELIEESRQVFQAINDQNGVSNCLNDLGVIAYHQANYLIAKAYFQQSLVLRQAIGDQRGIAGSFNNLGSVALQQKNFEQARDYFQKCYEISDGIGDNWHRATTLTSIGFIQIKTQQDDAMEYFLQSLKIVHQIGESPLTLEVLVGFARVYLQYDNPYQAASLVSMVDAHAIEDIEVQKLVDEITPILEQTLSAEELASAQENGKTLDISTVIHELLVEFSPIID